jgi:hypothetical protein
MKPDNLGHNTARMRQRPEPVRCPRAADDHMLAMFDGRQRQGRQASFVTPPPVEVSSCDQACESARRHNPGVATRVADPARVGNANTMCFADRLGTLGADQATTMISRSRIVTLVLARS